MKTILVDAVYCFDIEKENGVFGVFDEMYELLSTYPNPKILCTGADDEQFKKWNLDIMPYDVFTMKHNPEKTDPMYYHILLETYDLSPKDVIYFEHDPAAVESARSVGITSYYYDPEKKDLVGLKNFLDNNIEREGESLAREEGGEY